MKWTEPEIALLRKGKIPPKRSPKAARTRCSILHIPLSGELLNVDMSPRKYNKTYTQKDLDLLANHIAPVGWSYELCRYVCRTRLHTKFLSKSTQRLSRIIERAESIIKRLNSGETQKTIAESLGISHQRVAQIIKDYRKINVK